MTPLRILHVVPYFEDAWAYGGIPRLVSAMTRGLARRGHHVTVCTTDACDQRQRLNTPQRASSDYEGVSVRIFRNLSNRLAYDWQFFTPLGMRRFLRSSAREFDIAHIHGCHHWPGAVAAQALVAANVPYVLSPNGTAPRIERRRLAKLAFDLTVGRRVLPDASRILAVSEAERRQLEGLGVDAARIRPLPNPLDEREFKDVPDGTAFRADKRLGDSRVVLYLGKLTPRKGLPSLVRAFAKLRDASARLVIAGNDMGSGSTIGPLARELGIERQVVRPGLLRGRHRLDALAAANVVVYPSRDEVFGLVPIEALTCGRPVVVCHDSGCGEVIGRVGGGHIVPYGDVDSLSGAIASILGSPDLWNSRAEKAGRRALALFGASTVCAALEQIYADILPHGPEATSAIESDHIHHGRPSQPRSVRTRVAP